jgi:hypothetical protein
MRLCVATYLERIPVRSCHCPITKESKVWQFHFTREETIGCFSLKSLVENSLGILEKQKAIPALLTDDPRVAL